MKKYLLIALVAVSLAGATTLSVRHYNKYQREEASKRQVVADAQAKAIADAKAARVDIVAKYENQRLNCERGAAAYALLTTVVKARTEKPVCGAVITK